MKTTRLLLTLLLSTMFTTMSRGQDKTDGWGDIRLGPLFSGGAAANAGNVAQGTKTSPLPCFSGGALVDLPLTEHLALDLSTVYDARSINFHDQANSDLGVDYNYGYLALRPTLRFSGLNLGLGVGFPVYASTTGHGGAAEPNVNTNDMNVLYEGRIGGQFTLFENKTGRLSLTLEGSYALNKILSSKYFGTSNDEKNNGPLASSQIGLVYLFDLTRQETPLVAIAR